MGWITVVLRAIRYLPSIISLFKEASKLVDKLTGNKDADETETVIKLKNRRARIRSHLRIDK